jgi:hypothetical protein
LITSVPYNWFFLQPPPFSPYNTPPPLYFGGGGAPLPYGVSSRYGYPVPPSGMRYDYGAPVSAHGMRYDYGAPASAHGMRYDYGAPASAHGPYSPVPTFPPGSYGGTFFYCNLYILFKNQNKETFWYSWKLKSGGKIHCHLMCKDMVGNFHHRCT